MELHMVFSFSVSCVFAINSKRCASLRMRRVSTFLLVHAQNRTKTAEKFLTVFLTDPFRISKPQRLTDGSPILKRVVKNLRKTTSRIIDLLPWRLPALYPFDVVASYPENCGETG